MPVYNCQRFLGEAIASVLNQTFSDFELIIIDGGSNDGSDEVIKKYLDDPRVVYYKSEEKKGIARDLNIGLGLAKAEIIARMDGDDICEPDRFEKQYDYLLKNPEIVLVGTYVNLINEKGKFIGRKIKPLDYKSIERDLFAYCPFIHPSVMFRKKIIVDLGKYKEELSSCEDYELWFRIIYAGYQVANLPIPLLRYRFYESWTLKRKKVEDKNNFKIRREALKKYKIKSKIRKIIFMYGHLISGIFFTGEQLRKMENLYKKIFYGE